MPTCSLRPAPRLAILPYQNCRDWRSPRMLLWLRAFLEQVPYCTMYGTGLGWHARCFQCWLTTLQCHRMAF